MAQEPSASTLPSATRFEWVESCASTNGELLARLSRGESIGESHWLIAHRQTAGRGRLGREWQDGAGNFMGSTVVPIRSGEPAPHTLALVAGVALFDAVNPLVSEGRLRLKWPNDLILDNAKLAGILLERQGGHVVIGIGVNLASAPNIEERATIALADKGTQADPMDVAKRIDHALKLELARWRGAGLAATIAQWTTRGAELGAAIAAHLPDGQRVTGAYRGLSRDGGLLIGLADGTTRTIHAGEIALLASERG